MLTEQPSRNQKASPQRRRGRRERNQQNRLLCELRVSVVKRAEGNPSQLAKDFRLSSTEASVMSETIKPGMAEAERAEHSLMMTRRYFFGLCSLGIGTAALATLLAENGYASMLPQGGEGNPGLPGVQHFAPKAKR